MLNRIGLFGVVLLCALGGCTRRTSRPEESDTEDASVSQADAGKGDGGSSGDAGFDTLDSGFGSDAGANLSPLFDVIPNQTLNEDAAAIAVNVTGLSAGSAAEDALQTVALSIDTAPSGILTATIGSGSSGQTLTLTPLQNANGTATLTVTALDSEGASFSRTFTVQVVPVNDAPTLNTPSAQSLLGGQVRTITLTGVSPGGGADEQAQTLTIEVHAADPSLFQNLEASLSGTTGTVTLTAAAALAGSTTVTVTIRDGQSTNASTSVSFPVTVTLNPPSITAASVTAGQQSGCVTVSYTLADDHSLPANVTLEVDDGSGFRPATVRTAGTVNVTSSPSGVAHTLTWRSPADLPPADFASLRLRLTPTRSGITGIGRTVNNVSLGNSVQFNAARTYPTGPNPQQAIVADMNGDGIADVVSADSVDVTVSVMSGKRDGQYESPVSYVTTPATCGMLPAKPFSVTAADFNEDGRLDLLAVHQNCQTIGVLLSQGTSGFLPYSLYAVGETALFASTGDFDQDGHLDVAVVNYGSNDVSVLRGLGNGQFQAMVRYATGINPNKIEAGDFNNDGWLDLVTADMADDRISLFINDHTGHFLPAQPFPAGLGPRNLGVGDLNADGRLDVVTANPGPDNTGTSIRVLLQTATGGFATPVPYTVQIHPRSVAIADVNNDGHLDVAIGNVDSASVSVLMGLGNGTLTAARNFTVGNGPHSVALRDVTGDGRLDLLTGDSYATQFSVLDNTTAQCGP